MAVGVELVQDDAALTHIRQLFVRRGRPMPERNRLQAQFPRGSRIVPNPHGTAPGIDITVNRPCCPPCRVFALPGVPDEMFAMWMASVAPALIAQGPRRVIRHRRIKCFGVGESDLEAMLPDMIRRQREPLVGITVSGATITLRITASGPNDVAARREMEPTVKQIYEILGVLVFGEEEDELEHAVVSLLQERRQTVAVAEWATDGLVGQWLAEADTTNSCFRGSELIRDPTSLRSFLDIASDRETGATGTTAASMARAVRDKTNADWGLGIAALPIDSTMVPTAADSIVRERKEMSGTLHVGLATAENVQVKPFLLASHPAITKSRSAKHALNMLRLALLNQTK
jgi:nicotinamide-nucleotide amidase